MYRSTRYFQVTPEILLEYDYATNYSLYNQDGDVSDVLIDLNGDRVISTLDNAYDSTRIALNQMPKESFAIATAVTYMGEQTGNKLSEFLW